MPYGEEIPRTNYGQDAVREKFATYERDQETDLDFAQARFHSSVLGRFYSVDFENAGAIDADPQSWNGYAYVGNNPINITDPTGLIWLTNGEGWYEWVDDDKYDPDDEYWKGWTEVKVGTMVYFGGEASGRFTSDEYQRLAGVM